MSHLPRLPPLSLHRTQHPATARQLRLWSENVSESPLSASLGIMKVTRSCNTTDRQTVAFKIIDYTDMMRTWQLCVALSLTRAPGLRSRMMVLEADLTPARS